MTNPHGPFLPLDGPQLVTWIMYFVLSLFLLTLDATHWTAFGGFLVGYTAMWAWVRYRYESIEFRTAIEEVSG